MSQVAVLPAPEAPRLGMPASGRVIRRRAAAVFGVSLVIRLIWVSFAHVTPVSDFAFYHHQAHNLLVNGTYEHLDKKAWVPPGYPVFLAGVYAVFGEGRLALGMVQSVLGAIASGLVVLLAGRVMSAGVASLAGVLHAVSPTMIAYVPATGSENVAIPLLLGTLLVIDAAGGRQEPRGGALAALAGLLCGLLLLSRSALLFVAPAGALLLACDLRRRAWSLGKPLIFMLMLGLSLLPWVLRNYSVGLGFMPFTSSGGMGLYLVSNDTCLNGEWGEASHEFVHGMSEKDWDRAYRSAAGQWIRQNPARYAALCRTRLARLLGAEADVWAARMLTPTAGNDQALTAEFADGWEGKPAPAELLTRARKVVSRNAQYLYWLNVVFFSPLALTAVLLALVRWRQTAILVLPVGCYLAGLALTIASMRYRLLSDPLLYILIAALLWDVFAGTSELGRRPGRLAKAALAVLAIHASLLAHASGLADRMYQLRGVPVQGPDVSRLRFQRVDLLAANPSWVCRTQTQLAPEPQGLRCTVSGTADASAAQYGGLALPVNGCAAVRLDLSLLNPQQILRIFVDLTDAADQRVARWQWNALGRIPEAELKGTYVFVPGKPVGCFKVEESPSKKTASSLHVFLEVFPRTQAGFILHRAEVGR